MFDARLRRGVEHPGAPVHIDPAELLFARFGWITQARWTTASHPSNADRRATAASGRRRRIGLPAAHADELVIAALACAFWAIRRDRHGSAVIVVRVGLAAEIAGVAGSRTSR